MNRLGSCLAIAVATSSLLFASRAAADEPVPPPAAQPATAPEPLPPVTITYTMPQATPASGAAAAADRPAPAAPMAGTPRYDLLRISVGPRFDYVPSAGFDSFADSNLLASFSIDATYPLFARGKIAVGVGLGFTAGGRSDDLRGMKTKLGVFRMQVPIEGRYHFLPGVFAFAKVAPGAVAMAATLEEASSPNTIDDTGWAFSADASVGAGILVGPRGSTAEGGTGPNADREKRTVRFWAIPEVGYGFTTRTSLDLRPDRDAKDALGTDERTALSPIGLTAFFWRLSVATTF